MEVYATVTQKGQITIPNKFRKHLGIKPYSKVALKIKGKIVELKSEPDIFDIAPIGYVPRGKNALLAREYMAKNYKPR